MSPIDDPTTGVWLHPTGPRVEITRTSVGWQVAAFPTRQAPSAGARTTYTTVSDLQQTIGGLEEQGYVLAPGRPPGAEAIVRTHPLGGAALIAGAGALAAWCAGSETLAVILAVAAVAAACAWAAISRPGASRRS